MSSKASVPPQYDPLKVGRALLFEVVEQHPARLTVADLSRIVLGNPKDSRERETIAEAMKRLEHAGLFAIGDTAAVEPTRAALYAHELVSA